MSLAQMVHEKVAAVAPITSAVIGKPEDKGTWRIVFAADATKEQREAALAVLAGIDATVEAKNAEVLQKLIEIDAQCLAPRWLRESVLAMKDAPQTLGIERVRQAEEAAEELRAQLVK